MARKVSKVKSKARGKAVNRTKGKVRKAKRRSQSFIIDKVPTLIN